MYIVLPAASLSQEAAFISRILDVEGAAGQLVPHLEFNTVDGKFLAEECGTDATISTLAVVRPDQRCNTKTLVDGTNLLWLMPSSMAGLTH